MVIMSTSDVDYCLLQFLTGFLPISDSGVLTISVITIMQMSLVLWKLSINCSKIMWKKDWICSRFVGLPGLTQRYIFNRMEEDDYFVGFGREHKHYAKEMRDSILGGPSIIFHRGYERLKTLIKGIKDNFCRCVQGFDANALYLY